MTNRKTRFWLVGLVLILGNIGYSGYKLVALKQSLTVPEMVFHGTVLLVALAMFDRELAKEVFDRLVRVLPFLRKNGGPPPPAEAA